LCRRHAAPINTIIGERKKEKHIVRSDQTKERTGREKTKNGKRKKKKKKKTDVKP